MAISVQPYTPDIIPAVKAFNQRLAAGGIGAEFHFPESNTPQWLPEINGRSIFQRYYVAVDGDQVRGAFILKYQNFHVGSEVRRVVYYHLPVSEGIVNKSFAGVGVMMMRSALKLEPCLFALGMGGFGRPLPMMLKALGWKMCAVPFYFRVEHPARFLRNIAPVRQDARKKRMADLAAFSGAGWIGIKAFHAVRSKSRVGGISVEPVTSFGEWADALWQASVSKYPLVASRESRVLNVLYPPGKNFLCYKVSRNGEVVGWFVGLDTQMKNNKYFGNLRVGTIADAFAAPEHALAVVQSARSVLRDRGVDLVVANHAHQAWGEAFRGTGFLPGPSNFIFAASRGLFELFPPFEQIEPQLYFMRGDGDGPVNL
jgi:hypothetical protein